MVGTPNPNVGKAMEDEHMQMPDSKVPFVTSNYGISSTSWTEWKFVVEPSSQEARANTWR